MVSSTPLITHLPDSLPVVVAEVIISLFQERYVWSPNFLSVIVSISPANSRRTWIRKETTNLGLMRCAAVKKAPSRIQRPPTTMYAIPRKLFLPPITERVEMSRDLVPP